MQQAATNTTNTNPLGFMQSPSTREDRLDDRGTQTLDNYQIIRRNGAVVPFEPSKIAVAVMKAFLAVHGTQGAASASVRDTVDGLTQAVIRALMRSRPGGGTFHIEDVQDQVELGLMRGGHHEVARSYVLYREKRTQERAKARADESVAAPAAPALHVMDGGERVVLDMQRLNHLITTACAGLGNDVQPAPIMAETLRNLYDGVPMDEVYKASIMATRTLIESEPDYTYVTARLLLHTIRREILGEGALLAHGGLRALGERIENAIELKVEPGLFGFHGVYSREPGGSAALEGGPPWPEGIGLASRSR